MQLRSPKVGFPRRSTTIAFGAGMMTPSGKNKKIDGLVGKLLEGKNINDDKENWSNSNSSDSVDEPLCFNRNSV
jgi:hypothetical protein